MLALGVHVLARLLVHGVALHFRVLASLVQHGLPFRLQSRLELGVTDGLCGGFGGGQSVDGAVEGVQYAPEQRLAHGHLDGMAAVAHDIAARQAAGRGEGDAAHMLGVEMLDDLDLHAGRLARQQAVTPSRQARREAGIHDAAADGGDGAGVVGRFAHAGHSR